MVGPLDLRMSIPDLRSHSVRQRWHEVIAPLLWARKAIKEEGTPKCISSKSAIYPGLSLVEQDLLALFLFFSLIDLFWITCEFDRGTELNLSHSPGLVP